MSLRHIVDLALQVCTRWRR